MDLFERRKAQYLRITSELLFISAPFLVLLPSYCGYADFFHSNLIPYREKYADNARTEYDKDLAVVVLADKPDMVVCAGWMSILADTFLDPLAEANVPIINLHPALPVGCNSFPVSKTVRPDMIRDNSTALRPPSEHIRHGLRLRLRRLAS